jgi:hypothetical protein
MASERINTMGAMYLFRARFQCTLLDVPSCSCSLGTRMDVEPSCSSGAVNLSSRSR